MMGSYVWLVAALVLVQVYEATCISSKKNVYNYYMQDHCGKTLRITDRGVADVHLTRFFGYKPLSCNFTVLTDIPHERVQARIVTVDTNHQKFTSCQTSDYLQLYSVNSDKSTRLLTGDGVCGTELLAPKQMIESDQTTMLLVFTSQGPTDEPYRGFHLRFTAFHPEECREGEFECGNMKCIRKSLTCDGFDNCGDETDEDRDMAGCRILKHDKRDINTHEVITNEELNELMKANPDLLRASAMDSHNKTHHHDTGGVPKFTNTILMIVGVSVGVVLILISVVACIVNRRLKTDRVDIARSSFTWSQTGAPSLDSGAFGY